MKKISLNNNWICKRAGQPEQGMTVNIPHDAMQMDEKDELSAGGVHNGWYVCHDYIYEKAFCASEDWREKRVILEFEGIYKNAIVFLNGERIAVHEYGYTGFYIDISERLCYEKDNSIKVYVSNSEQPNSRWYSGTGIYRPVWLYLLPVEHIEMDGIRITTLPGEIPAIGIDIATTGDGELDIEILEKGQLLTKVSSRAEQKKCHLEISLPQAKRWMPEQPQLYLCRVTFGEDQREERFGIREIRCDAQNGFCINGKRIILRGACIHHDNGLLGACAYDYAEYRKIRILKENGYNAIRSAHNPCSKAMLRACDELGMLVLDEYVDVWYIHKTKYDYADRVIQNYETDLKAMTDKDYNHPSVVMYSIGNEVSETAQKKGIELCGKMTQKLHELDGTRPVTCGINIFFNFLSSIGFGVYSDKKAEQETKNSKRKKVGSEFFNSLAGILGAGFMKFGATLYPCDLKTRDAFGKLDIAGYNYGINRYRHDLKKYPSRLILGSETFCSDAAKFYQLAQKNPRIIGDFVWAGMDYLGEVGVGAWEYADYAPRFDGGKGWVSAGSGRIDLTGKPLAEMAYTQVAFGLRELAVGVIPVNHTKDKHSPSAWKMSNALESWSYEGYDGETACVEVSTGAAYVEFILNDEIIRKRKVKNRECFQTKIPYRSGTLQIKAYAADGSLIAEQRLQTAGRETQLRMFPEQTTIDTSKLCYIRICYTDENGILKPLIRDELRVEVSGGILLGFGNACPYHERSYKGDVTDTYYGEALAIIQPQEMGEITVRATGNYGTAETKIKVRV